MVKKKLEKNYYSYKFWLLTVKITFLKRRHMQKQIKLKNVWTELSVVKILKNCESKLNSKEF